MTDEKNENITLAQFVSQKRETLGLNALGLAKKCNLTVEEIEGIEAGIDLFISTTVRQKLAKGLRVTIAEIKKLEPKEDFGFKNNEEIEEELKELILNGAKDLKCPICGAKLITRIAKMYDLEDNLMLHPKARCSVCPYQIRSLT